jgi:hypothetical protein
MDGNFMEKPVKKPGHGDVPLVVKNRIEGSAAVEKHGLPGVQKPHMILGRIPA